MGKQFIPITKPILTENETQAVAEVLSSGILVQGPKVQEFEKKFAKYLGVKHAIAVSSGTAALHLALLAAGIKKNDEVITTPYSFVASATAILFCNAIPVFIDIDKSYNLDSGQITAAITEKTKAILPVHLFGHPADMPQIAEIANRRDLIVIEDCAQALGAEISHKKVGTFGTVACFSFYPSKAITTGEGGLIATNDGQIADKARLLRDHGQIAKYEHIILGYNLRMTEIAAAIGLCQLEKLDEWNEKRIENAEQYAEQLKKIKDIEPPFVAHNVKHVFNLYVCQTKQKLRNKIVSYLQKNGIDARKGYPRPIYRQLLFKNHKYRKLPCDKTEQIINQVLQLPIHPLLSKSEIEYIVTKLKESFKKSV
ncbi:MAG: DegT/DnrJ/EryC1/StrS family aminotransferase [Euryarchaeota archaeon]|nr:DegT/DnrJ/EryC1/StrS family aminotransferase [Euryarchaeota archaeon]